MRTYKVRHSKNKEKAYRKNKEKAYRKNKVRPFVDCNPIEKFNVCTLG